MWCSTGRWRGLPRFLIRDNVTSHWSRLKLSVGVSGNPYLLEIDGLFTQGWRPGRTVGDSVGGIFEADSSDWSNGIRYHIFGTRPDTETTIKIILNNIAHSASRG